MCLSSALCSPSRSVDLGALNRKYCICKWVKDETLTSRESPQLGGVPKCRAKRADSAFPNSFVMLSKDEDTAVRDLLVLGYGDTEARALFKEYEGSSFKKDLRIWVGHHYPTNMTVTHKEGKPPTVKIHPHEAHPDTLKKQAAGLGPIPACPYNSDVDHVTGGQRRGSSGVGRGSPTAGVDPTTGSNAAFGLGAHTAAPFEAQAAVMAAAAAAAESVAPKPPAPESPAPGLSDREQRMAAKEQRTAAAAAAARAAAPPGVDELRGRSALMRDLGMTGLDDDGKHDVKSDTCRYPVELRPPNVFVTSFNPMLECVRMAEEHAQ
eukprot:SAG22_NODE_1693_length_3799_cov_2.227568_4_plen_321_part_01